ncbi:hypothetical protein Acsp06_64330 [Actinomycetospora sp. NBRC 106375]|nr:hypothetical protein Acsp06_64330 [Actinomycetospora sp. NBRC 106375]
MNRPAQPGIELIQALLAVHSEADDAARESLNSSLVLRVRQYVRDHLHERDLTPQRIAAAHHVSVRLLYAVLAGAEISLRPAGGSCGTRATPTRPSPPSDAVGTRRPLPLRPRLPAGLRGHPERLAPLRPLPLLTGGRDRQ